MRIPVSSIVMVLALAVAIVLAVRDTSDSGDHARFTSKDEARELARASRREQLALDEQRRTAADEAKRARREAIFPRAIGERPAQLGPMFAGVELGAPAARYEPDAVARAREAAQRDGTLHVYYDADAIKLAAVNLRLQSIDRLECEHKLEGVWGASSAHAAGVWLDPAAHQRAALQDYESECAIRFDRYDEPREWVASLPIKHVNAPVKQMKVDPSAYVSEHEIDWRGPGVGAGRTATNYTMTIDKGNVTGVLVNGDTDPVSVDAIRNLLTADLGVQPKRTDNHRGTIYMWAARPPITLLVTEKRFSLDLGGRERLDR